MRVYLKCFASLSDKYEWDQRDNSQLELFDGQSVEDLIRKNGITLEKGKLVFVNGKKVVDQGRLISVDYNALRVPVAKIVQILEQVPCLDCKVVPASRVD